MTYQLVYVSVMHELVDVAVWSSEVDPLSSVWLALDATQQFDPTSLQLLPGSDDIGNLESTNRTGRKVAVIEFVDAKQFDPVSVRSTKCNEITSVVENRKF